MKVRFAVSVGLGSPDPYATAEVLTGLESRGFDTVWLSDVPSVPGIDSQLGIAYAAGVTQRLKLGANFIPFGQRPFMFAHRLAQLDQLSSGRLLVTLVPGLDLPGERGALGTAGRHRGHMMDELIPKVRAWWAGEEVDGASLTALPLQKPLEVWLGGSGPDAISRAGRLADGWLGAFLSAGQAGAVREAIQAAATEAGRTIDPEHFGLSLGYARHAEDLERTFRIRRARPTSGPGAGEVDRSEVTPVGRDALRAMIGRLVDAGISKFVVRPVAPVESWPQELDWLADAVLDLQT